MPLKILTDDLEEYPTLQFQKYSKVIMDLIEESYPNFSIGLYGEWGTGKTTLMKFIYNQLKLNGETKNQLIIPVWFNAWMYERENQFALFPLLQTIVSAIPETDENKTIVETLKKFGRGIGKGLLKSTPELISQLLPSMISEPLKGTTKEIANKISDEFLTFFDKVNEQLDEQTIYSTQIEKIKEDISKVLRKDKTKSFRIVVFVDDLDRCNPKTTLEVFESIKIFLGIEGFIYILGISNETIIIFLNNQFENLINGEQYLRKIIQIPITLPEWNDYIISNELIDKYVYKLSEPYKGIIFNNREFITKLIEFNPREVKRFINSFIIARELFIDEIDISDKTTKEIFAIQALKIRWPHFTSILSTNEEFRFLIEKYTIEISSEETMMDTIAKMIDVRQKEAQIEADDIRIEKEGVLKVGEQNHLQFKRRLMANEKILFQFGEVYDLWKFLFINQHIIFNITNWNLYNKLAKITVEQKNIKNEPESKRIVERYKRVNTESSAAASREGS